MCKNRFYLGLVARPKLNDWPRSKGGEHGGKRASSGARQPGLPRSQLHPEREEVPGL